MGHQSRAGRASSAGLHRLRPPHEFRVSQQDLQEFLQLKQQLKAEKRFKALRQKILQTWLDDPAAIEPGPFTPEIASFERRVIRWKEEYRQIHGDEGIKEVIEAADLITDFRVGVVLQEWVDGATAESSDWASPTRAVIKGE